MNYLCPLCSSPLGMHDVSWTCEQGHSFDVARQGYVNLLPVQHKKSKLPGDSPEMVAARQQFLAQGFYEPLKQALVSAVGESAEHLVDVGCGEGYYTQGLASRAIKLTAIDISKSAAISCAKALNSKNNPNQNVLVASSSNMPLADASASHITSIFAPIMVDEYARVLKTHGQLIIAKPDDEHLLALRKLLFNQVQAHDSMKFLEQLKHQFDLVDTVHVEADLQLNNAQINQLLDMTPYAYRAKPEKRAQVAALNVLEVQARFVVFILKKK